MVKVFDTSNQNQHKKSSVGLFNNLFGSNAMVKIGDGDEALRPVHFFEMFRFALTSDRLFAVFGLLCAFVAGCIQLANYYLCGRFADILIRSGTDTESQDLWRDGMTIVLINGGIGAFIVVVTFLMFLFLRLFCIRMVDHLCVQYLQSILRQDAEWLDTQRGGSLISILNENVEYIRDGMGEKLGLIVRGVSMFVAGFLMSLIVDWRITCSMLPMIPCTFAVMVLLMKKVDLYSTLQLASGEKAGAVLQESVLNVKTVQSLNGQKSMVNRFSSILDEGRVFATKQYLWNGFCNGAHMFFQYMFYGVGLYVGAIQLMSGRVSPGDVLIVTSAVCCVSWMVSVVTPLIGYVLKATAAAASIYKVIDRKPKIGSHPAAITSLSPPSLERPLGRIEFKDVHFAYSSRQEKPVLNGLSWEAQSGQTVALVGHSGSGKSTCISLLTRLYECAKGSVEIDGVDVRSMNVPTLRQMIGIVMQEPTLFNGTIYDNVALGDETITLDRVREACKQANADEYINRLEMGYFTVIGAGGIQLSGGQKQRLAIARALIRDPPILLLDEATSALDAESEVLVQNALQSASKGRTTIIIAHRLSTLRSVDKIVVIDGGKVVEEGAPNDLISKPGGGFYSTMVKAQQFDAPSTSPPPMQFQQFNSTPDTVVTQANRANARASVASMISVSSMAVSSDFGGDHRLEALEKFRQRRSSNRAASISSFFSSGLMLFYRRCCTGNWGLLIIAVLLTCIRALDVPAYGVIVNYLFSAFNSLHGTDSQSFMSEMMWISIINNSIGLALLPLTWLAISAFGVATERIVDGCKVKSLTNVLDQDAPFFDHSTTSNPKIIQRISSDSIVLKAATDTHFFFILSNLAQFVFSIILSFYYGWELSTLGLVVVLVEAVVFYLFGKRVKNLFWQIHKTDESANTAVEIVENARTIQLLGRESYFIEKYKQKLQETRWLKIKIALYDALIFSIARSFIFICFFASFGCGLYLIYEAGYTPVQIYVQSIILNMATETILTISMYFNDYLKAGPSADSLWELMSIKSVIREKKDALTANLKGSVEFQRVRFAYPSRPETQVAKGLSLRAEKGQTVALVGPSGGGKSTVIQLMQRFYQPNEGFIKIDGHDIFDFSLEHLRGQMALVGQEPVLFSGTIRSNILLGVEEQWGENDIHEACRIANASNFIESLPQGYDTECGERGSQMSGGQKQRLSIARALIRQPKILLLDEATSALDAQSERVVQEALDAASEGRTVITIAHRLASIQHADKIYFIRDGRVVERGTHQELMQMESDYAKMVHKQEMFAG